MNQKTNIEAEFDLAALRVDNNFAETMPVRNGLTLLPVRKPDKQWFIRVNDDPSWFLDAAILELKDDNENYLVVPDLIPSLTDEVKIKRLVVGINRQNTVFIWPIKLPTKEGKVDEWNRSAMKIAELAKAEWVRVTSNTTMGMYESLVAQNRENLPEPEWPTDGFDKLIQAAFKDRIISSPNHPVLMRLRGEL